jgi:hypothetical protein
MQVVCAIIAWWQNRMSVDTYGLHQNIKFWQKHHTSFIIKPEVFKMVGCLQQQLSNMEHPSSQAPEHGNCQGSLITYKARNFEPVFLQQFNLPFSKAQFLSVNLKLLSRPCNLWKYYSAHIGIFVLKCFQFHFEYSLAVLAMNVGCSHNSVIQCPSH